MFLRKELLSKKEPNGKTIEKYINDYELSKQMDNIGFIISCSYHTPVAQAFPHKKENETIPKKRLATAATPIAI
jgi:hypothetical protein